MPNKDQTGPMGQGPLTGRGLGPCGAGLARGKGLGRGIALGCCPQTNQVTLTKAEEKKILEQELKEIVEEQEDIKKRLKGLKE
jgi:hypothetical protein